METRQLVDRIVEVLDSKKGREITSIGISKISIIADSFVLCTGTSCTHVKALAESVEKTLKDDGISALNVSGYNTSKWILLDYGSVFVHIFDEDARHFYDIERLWSDGVVNRFLEK